MCRCHFHTSALLKASMGILNPRSLCLCSLERVRTVACSKTATQARLPRCGCSCQSISMQLAMATRCTDIRFCALGPADEAC